MSFGSLSLGTDGIPAGQAFLKMLSEEGYSKEHTEIELNNATPLKASYIYSTESKAWRITKLVLSIIIFPIGLYQIAHLLLGRLGLIASRPTAMGAEYAGNYALNCRQSWPQDWQYKRFTVQVDGANIDAYIITKHDTVNNGRWLLKSNGVGQFAEECCFSERIPSTPVVPEAEEREEEPALRYRKSRGQEFRQILTSLESNAIIFNYPGVGSSGGVPNRSTMVKAYKAMLTVLEDKTIGLGAKEIIGYGHSIGGGIQGDVLKTHELKDNIKYVFVKSRTFSNLSTALDHLTSHSSGCIAGFITKMLIKFFGWNLDSVESSRTLKAPEIILQTAAMPDDEARYEELESAENALKIKDEEAVFAEASLAGAMLRNPDWDRTKKRIFGIRETHSQPILDTKFVTDAIEEFLTR